MRLLNDIIAPSAEFEALTKIIHQIEHPSDLDRFALFDTAWNRLQDDLQGDELKLDMAAVARQRAVDATTNAEQPTARYLATQVAAKHGVDRSRTSHAEAAVMRLFRWRFAEAIIQQIDDEPFDLGPNTPASHARAIWDLFSVAVAPHPNAEPNRDPTIGRDRIRRAAEAQRDAFLDELLRVIQYAVR